MSIEYFAQTNISITEEHIASIKNFINTNSRFELLCATETNQIALRFVDIPKREVWPEDATITFEDSTIYLALHSCPRDERESFIRELSQFLNSIGLICEFEED